MPVRVNCPTLHWLVNLGIAILPPPGPTHAWFEPMDGATGLGEAAVARAGISSVIGYDAQSRCDIGHILTVARVGCLDRNPA